MPYDMAMPKVGDVICVYRGPTKHFGVYVNEDSVVHFAPYLDAFSNYHCVRETNLYNFLHGRSSHYVAIFPREDEETGRLAIAPAEYGTIIPLPSMMRLYEFFREHGDCHIYSPAETAARALSKAGHRDYYDEATSNCEHFVVWCKTGINDKRQVKTLISLLPIVPIHSPVHEAPDSGSIIHPWQH